MHDRPKAHRKAFADEMSAKLGIAVRAVDRAREAVRGADILATCTDSMAPVYEADWIEPGMHVTNLNPHELPDAAIDRFDVFVRQGVGGLEMTETERFQIGRGGSPAAFIGGTPAEMERIPGKVARRGLLGDSPAFSKLGRAVEKPDFVELVTGNAKGRTSPEQVTFYRNIGNQGLQFSSVGGWVYQQAAKQKKGREIPTEWFLQDIRD